MKITNASYKIRNKDTDIENEEILITTGCDSEIWISIPDFQANGYNSNLCNYVGGNIDLQYFKSGEKLFNGALCTKGDTEVRDYSISPNPHVLGYALFLEGKAKMEEVLRENEKCKKRKTASEHIRRRCQDEDDYFEESGGYEEQISKENKDFYKDLVSTIKIQLDDNKSQIKELIENERNQIKQIFEIEFAKNTKELRQAIETETNKQTNLLLDNQKVIKISLWVISGLTLILSIVAVIRLWGVIIQN